MTDFATRRRVMVDTQVRPSDVTKFPIIDAMLSVPREMFVPDAMREAAYSGGNVDFGDDRVLLEPRTLAKMLDVVDIQPDEMVLDVGALLGYSSAVAAHMAQVVVALEEDADLAREAQNLLSEVGADNAIVHNGPLAEGAQEHGPYDVVLIEGGVAHLPDAISAQTKDGGRIVCLFVEGALGVVRVGYKSGGVINWRFEFNAGAPVLPGFEKSQAFAL
ncbi:MAG: protein-L-isoaspartate O-methyltransferase [Arenibacterium sp.]